MKSMLLPLVAIFLLLIFTGLGGGGAWPPSAPLDQLVPLNRDIPLWTETPPGKRPHPGQITPGQSLPLDRDPPGRNMGPGTRLP